MQEVITTQSRSKIMLLKKFLLPNSKLSFIIYALFIGIIVFLAHIPSLFTEATSFDDGMYFLDNYLVNNPSFYSIIRFLTEVKQPTTVYGYYQPLTMISLMIDYALGARPDNLLIFHITSVTIHSINSILVGLFIYMLFKKTKVSLVCALLFGLHPIAIDTIVWVSERKSLLSTLFTLISMVLYLSYVKNKSWKPYTMAVLSFLLALMSKPTGIMLPFLFILLDYWPIKRLTLKSTLDKIPFFVLILVFSFITYISQASTASVNIKSSPLQIIMIFCHNITYYLEKFSIPIKLLNFCPFPEPFNFSNFLITKSLVFTLIFTCVVVISLRWTKALLVSTLFFLIAIAPTLGILQVTSVIANLKYMYLPMIGLLVFIAYVSDELITKLDVDRSKKIYFIVLPTLLILLLSQIVLSNSYTKHWKSNESLIKYSLDLYPQSHMSHLIYGLSLAEKKMYSQAIQHYEEAINIDHDFFQTYNNYAMALYFSGNIDGAIQKLKESISIRPGFAKTYYDLGTIFLKTGRNNEAIDMFNKCLGITPYDYQAHFALGVALNNQKKFDESILQYQEAIKDNPFYIKSYINLSTILASNGRPEDAYNILRKGLKYNSNNAEANSMLASVLCILRRPEESLVYYEKSLSVKNDDLQTSINYGKTLASLGKFDHALIIFNNALKIDPSNIDLHLLLGKVLAAKGQNEKAKNEFNWVLKNSPNNTEAKDGLSNLTK